MKSNIAAKTTELIKDAVAAAGYGIWDVEYFKEGADYNLRITIDSPDGITIDDCEKVHMTVDKLLDEADFIDNSYNLQVSSPGIERDLKRREHFDAMEGSSAEIRLFAADERGRKTYSGKLRGTDDTGVTLECADGTFRLPFEKISKAKTIYDFTEEGN